MIVSEDVVLIFTRFAVKINSFCCNDVFIINQQYRIHVKYSLNVNNNSKSNDTFYLIDNNNKDNIIFTSTFGSWKPMIATKKQQLD